MIVPAHAENVALTFDDLPIYGPRGTIEDARTLTRKLLAGLVRHRLPATGFVNEIQLEGAERDARAALLSQWLDAGMDLGNHSYSHLSLNHTPVEAYIADVARGETVTRALLAARGRQERWYRYPYLETGTTIAIRRRFEGWLADHGYRIAPVTMENSDWEFADRYDQAVARGDRSAARRIRKAYLAFTDNIVGWYRSAALGLLGRRPAFVFLLHASRLNADSIDSLARILRKNDLHAVTLDEATSDPAYAIADTYVGPDGDEWLTRWSLTLHKDLPWSTLPQVPKDISTPDAR
jgi:peptidoglycan/xylan/chitin deacetylase (PgdA/CDA1 family)